MALLSSFCLNSLHCVNRRKRKAADQSQDVSRGGCLSEVPSPHEMVVTASTALTPLLYIIYSTVIMYVV